MQPQMLVVYLCHVKLKPVRSAYHVQTQTLVLYLRHVKLKPHPRQAHVVFSACTCAHVEGSHCLLGLSSNSADAPHIQLGQTDTSSIEWRSFHLIRTALRRISTMSVEGLGERVVKMRKGWIRPPSPVSAEGHS